MNIRSASAELKTAANTSPHTVQLMGLPLVADDSELAG